MPMPKTPLDSDRFGRLSVLSSVNGGWLCRCDCGVEKVVSGSHLRAGAIVSCGCFHKEQQQKPVTHGKRRARIYIIWVNMIQRCTNEKNTRFQDYGARGITICNEWHQFENFYADMGDAPPGTSIDRIDNNGGYSKDNCRWATSKQQARNTRSNKVVTIGEVSKPLAEWCDDLGLKYWTVHARIRRGHSPIEALEQ